MSTTTQRTHVVLRIRPTIRIKWETLDVVSEHNKVLKREGVVALGKFGAAMPRNKLDALAAEIRQGPRTWFYLVTKHGDTFQAVRAIIKDVFPAGGEKERSVKCPAYYREMGLHTELGFKPSMWFLLSSQLTPCTLDHLYLVSNQRPLLKVLHECRTTMMVVTATAKTHPTRLGGDKRDNDWHLSLEEKRKAREK